MPHLVRNPKLNSEQDMDLTRRKVRIHSIGSVNSLQFPSPVTVDRVVSHLSQYYLPTFNVCLPLSGYMPTYIVICRLQSVVGRYDGALPLTWDP